MSERQYNFPVPYHFRPFEVRIAYGRLRSTGIFEMLPHYMQIELNQAYKSRSDYTLTQQDLDNINDEAWEKISQLLQ